MLKRIHLRPGASAIALLFILGSSACGSGAPVPIYAMSDRGGDRDQDGAPDMDDACAEEPEDGLAPKANDGCPATDPDNDGVLLGEDQCPNAKEDTLPPSAADGCPTDDADRDGVADAKDKCPAQSEDNTAPDPNDGCPAPDGDADGIADSRDRCPGTAEAYNGYRDDDGCPDTPAKDEVAFDDHSAEIYIPASKKIDFEKDSAELSPAAGSTVAEIANVLKKHPEIQRVEIEGHASSIGDAGYNVGLTDRRAQAVAAALTKLGIQQSRLVAIGYGEYCPAVDRGDNVDEPKNRRVLFKAVLVNGVWQSVARGCWKAQTQGIDPTKRRPGGSQGPSAPGPVVKPVGGA
jgi:outer membrane protein OmpA-like peptidoglycan-associated protein